jgi:predicted nuclease of restriction endonuclease-like RecB superfamily
VEELAAAANSAIVTALLRRSTFISVTVRGNARDIVSHAQQVGLLCSARMVGRSSASDVQQATVRLDIRGPMQLTRHVAAYAARLAALVPLLVATAPAFELEADCSIAGGRSKFRVRGGDGVRLSAAESRVSSPVHDALALDLEYRPGKWRVQRNAEAILADDRVWVPDFELKSAGRRRLVTIHEFWTPEWVGAEFARIRRDAAEAGLVLCLARAGNCGAGELPSDGAILMYTRRIPAARLIRVLDA